MYYQKLLVHSSTGAGPYAWLLLLDLLQGALITSFSPKWPLGMVAFVTLGTSSSLSGPSTWLLLLELLPKLLVIIILLSLLFFTLRSLSGCFLFT